ncbi:MAG: HK97 gp10 family phage protein [Rikenellaceae bacterium]|nr:HK97 gp10 family phage protein [Rikenellaceae bacterium]
MGKTIKPADLEQAIQQELTTYHRSLLARVNAAGEEAVKALVKKTKATAPRKSGAFRRAITYKVDENPATGDKRFTWGAKAPQHRLTHLLVHGHAKTDGGRVAGDPFLENALNEVLPAYEQAVEEAVKDDQ